MEGAASAASCCGGGSRFLLRRRAPLPVAAERRVLCGGEAPLVGALRRHCTFAGAARAAAHSGSGGDAALCWRGGEHRHISDSGKTPQMWQRRRSTAPFFALIQSYHIFILFSYHFSSSPVHKPTNGSTFNWRDIFGYFYPQYFVRGPNCPHGLADKIFVRGQIVCPHSVHVKGCRQRCQISTNL